MVESSSSDTNEGGANVRWIRGRAARRRSQRRAASSLVALRQVGRSSIQPPLQPSPFNPLPLTLSLRSPSLQPPSKCALPARPSTAFQRALQPPSKRALRSAPFEARPSKRTLLFSKKKMSAEHEVAMLELADTLDATAQVRDSDAPSWARARWLIDATRAAVSCAVARGHGGAGASAWLGHTDASDRRCRCRPDGPGAGKPARPTASWLHAWLTQGGFSDTASY